MPLYSTRLHLARTDRVFKYDDIPPRCRGQITHVWTEALPKDKTNGGHRLYPEVRLAWDRIEEGFAKHIGSVGSLPSARRSVYDISYNRCVEHFMTCSTEYALDWIEHVVGHMNTFHGSMEVKKWIDETNGFLQQNDVGYQYVVDRVIRVDSQYVHEEIVESALALVAAAGFTGVEQEFLNAHEHYRHGRCRDAIGDAGSAFESVMKAIAGARGWTYSPGATAAPLIDLLVSNKLIPEFLKNGMIGVATLRNKLGGHGQGATPVPAPPHLAAYALHMCASNIVMLVEAHRAMP